MFHRDLEKRIKDLERKTVYRVSRESNRMTFNGHTCYIVNHVDTNDVIKEILSHLGMAITIPENKSCELVKIEEDVKED